MAVVEFPTKKASVRKMIPQQRAAIFGLAKTRGLNDEMLHSLIEAEVEKTSIKELSFAEANKVIVALGGKSFLRGQSPRRTRQHHHKESGVTQIVTEEQLALINKLALKRNWTATSLDNFCRRMLKRPRPKTTIEANKIIEALKAMNSRDNL